MMTTIDNPKNINKEILDKIIDLVCHGNQVERRFIEAGIKSSEFIAITLENDNVVTTATLKNPILSYRNKVFKLANVNDVKDGYFKELGYIVTHPNYEGRKLCQELLKRFIPYIDKENVFATTRKTSMIHILGKFAFTKVGNTYNHDLNLLVNKYNGIA